MFQNIFKFLLSLWISFGVLPAAFGLSPVAGASARPAQVSLSDFFKNIYDQDGMYRYGQCGRNIKELLWALQQSGVDTRTFSVLFLLSESRWYMGGGPKIAGRLRPSLNRSRAREWDFHVILKGLHPRTHRPFIMDLDGPRKLLSPQKYFQLMFPNDSGEDRSENILMREIPSDIYLQAFGIFGGENTSAGFQDDNDIVGQFRKTNLPGLPVFTLRSYLNSL